MMHGQNHFTFQVFCHFRSCMNATQYFIFYEHKISQHRPFTRTHTPFSCFGCLRLQTRTYLSRTVLSSKMFRKARTEQLQNSQAFQKCTLEYRKCLARKWHSSCSTPQPSDMDSSSHSSQLMCLCHKNATMIHVLLITLRDSLKPMPIYTAYHTLLLLLLLLLLHSTFPSSCFSPLYFFCPYSTIFAGTLQ